MQSNADAEKQLTGCAPLLPGLKAGGREHKKPRALKEVRGEGPYGKTTG